mmetsp:Transcript_22144/g.63123  ORF Transcript_22144/g.63123 Transcript_22144/m.63123 type:complete len:190 (+) Transcript_22144:113-682(+)
MMNEQPPAAAAGGGVLHGSDAQTDQSSLLRNICDQFTSLQGQLCKRPHEALEFLLRKTKESPMSASRVEIAKGALSDLSTSIEAYKSAVSRVKGLALLEGNLKLFALRPPANNNTKSHEKKAQVGAESSDTTSPSSSAAAGGGGGAVPTVRNHAAVAVVMKPEPARERGGRRRALGVGGRLVAPAQPTD